MCSTKSSSMLDSRFNENISTFIENGWQLVDNKLKFKTSAKKKTSGQMVRVQLLTDERSCFDCLMTKEILVALVWMFNNNRSFQMALKPPINEEILVANQRKPFDPILCHDGACKQQQMCRFEIFERDDEKTQRRKKKDGNQSL